MKNVTRGPKPAILIEKENKWTTELMTAVAEYRHSGKAVPPLLLNRYRNKEIRDALKRMYSDEDGNNFCCYCESKIDVVDFPHIEHRKPKDPDLFPEEAFSWKNLHLACTKCNNKKSNQWDAVNPILCAVQDNPVSDHLSYEDDFPDVYRHAESPRGLTTIIQTDLNRKTLLKSRLILYHSILKLFREIVRLKNDHRTYTFREILKKKAKGEYGSLIQWSLEKWGLNE